jgi:hypothetical protein
MSLTELAKEAATREVVTKVNFRKLTIVPNTLNSDNTIHVLMCTKKNGAVVSHSAYRNFLSADAELRRLQDLKENLLNKNTFHIEQVPFFET